MAELVKYHIQKPRWKPSPYDFACTMYICMTIVFIKADIQEERSTLSCLDDGILVSYRGQMALQAPGLETEGVNPIMEAASGAGPAGHQQCK